MITSTKNYIKKTQKKQTKNPKMDSQNPRRSGKSKAIQRKSHKEVYTYTLRKREEGKKYIYLPITKKRKRATKSINKSTNDNKL